MTYSMCVLCSALSLLPFCGPACAVSLLYLQYELFQGVGASHHLPAAHHSIVQPLHSTA